MSCYTLGVVVVVIVAAVARLLYFFFHCPCDALDAPHKNDKMILSRNRIALFAFNFATN